MVVPLMPLTTITFLGATRGSTVGGIACPGSTGMSCGDLVGVRASCSAASRFIGVSCDESTKYAMSIVASPARISIKKDSRTMIKYYICLYTLQHTHHVLIFQYFVGLIVKIRVLLCRRNTLSSI